MGRLQINAECWGRQPPAHQACSAETPAVPTNAPVVYSTKPPSQWPTLPHPHCPRARLLQWRQSGSPLRRFISTLPTEGPSRSHSVFTRPFWRLPLQCATSLRSTGAPSTGPLWGSSSPPRTCFRAAARRANRAKDKAACIPPAPIQRPPTGRMSARCAGDSRAGSAIVPRH